MLNDRQVKARRITETFSFVRRTVIPGVAVFKSRQTGRETVKHVKNGATSDYINGNCTPWADFRLPGGHPGKTGVF